MLTGDIWQASFTPAIPIGLSTAEADEDIIARPTVNATVYWLPAGAAGGRGNRRGSERYLRLRPDLVRSWRDKPDTVQRSADWLGKNYLQNQEGFVHICRLDTAGARVLEN